MNALITADLTAEWCFLTLCALAIVKQLTHLGWGFQVTSYWYTPKHNQNSFTIIYICVDINLLEIFDVLVSIWYIREVPVLVKILSRSENKIPFESKSKQRFDKLSQMTSSGCFMSKLSLNPNSFWSLYVFWSIWHTISYCYRNCQFNWLLFSMRSIRVYLSISNSVRHAAEQHSSSVFGWTSVSISAWACNTVVFLLTKAFTISSK